MDRVGDGVAFAKSIFSGKDKKFWSKEVSWAYAKKIFGWKFDAWHIAKSGMVVFMVLAVISYKEVINPFADILFFGVAWNLSFNTFYNHILKIKNGSSKS